MSRVSCHFFSLLDAILRKCRSGGIVFGLWGTMLLEHWRVGTLGS